VDNLTSFIKLFIFSSFN